MSAQPIRSATFRLSGARLLATFSLDPFYLSKIGGPEMTVQHGSRNCRKILAQELIAATKMGYRRLTEYVGTEPKTEEVVASDGKRYQLEVTIVGIARKLGRSG